MLLLFMRVSVSQFSVSNITSVSAFVWFYLIMNSIHVSIKLSLLDKTFPTNRTLISLEAVVHVCCFYVSGHVQNRYPAYLTRSLSSVIHLS